MVNTYLFGIGKLKLVVFKIDVTSLLLNAIKTGEANTQVTVIGYQKPSLFEYLCDNILMERNRLEFKQIDKQKTLVTWNIFSRRKSLLFKVFRFFKHCFCEFCNNIVFKNFKSIQLVHFINFITVNYSEKLCFRFSF